jgi:hypothetical protein
MDIFDKLIQETIIDDETIIQYEKYLNFSLVKYLYKKGYYDKLKCILKHIKNNEKIIHKFFIYQENFSLFQDILINQLEFYKQLRWNLIHIENIPISNLKFILENINKFDMTMPYQDLIYSYYKVYGLLLPISESICVQSIVKSVLWDKNFILLKQICDKNLNFKICYLLIQYINENIEDNEILDWIFHHFNIYNNNDNTFVYYYFIFKSKNDKIIEWFFNFNKNAIQNDFKLIFNEINYSKRIDLLLKLYKYYPEITYHYINQNKSHLMIGSFEMYDAICSICSIPFDSRYLLSILNNQSILLYSYLCEMETRSPNFDWSQLHIQQFITYNIEDKNVLIFLKDKYPNEFDLYIQPLIENNISIQSLEMIEWYFEHYSLLGINLKNIEIRDLKVLNFLEKQMSFCMSDYDTIMCTACKYGYQEIIRYLLDKFSCRYEITFHKYLYDLFYDTLYKNYSLNIHKLRKIQTSSIDKKECLICYEMKHTYINTFCSHQYCQECFEIWFTDKKKTLCPYCRQDIIYYDKICCQSI